MILVDAGPLVAIFDRKDQDHKACCDTLRQLTRPMVTTWSAFTEAMHVLGDRAGWNGQEVLWKIVSQGDLKLNPLNDALVERTRELMRKYRDTPMDLADATLVALAEAMGEERIFTLDSDFRVYRLRGRMPFSILPQRT